MCDPVTLTLAATTLTAGAQVYGGMAAKSQGKYEYRVGMENARREEARIADATNRGRIEQMQRYRAASQSIGATRAAAAAAGLDTTVGAAFGSTLDTARIAGEDVYTIGENTRREITGFDINASNYRSRGLAARSAGKAAFVGSIISAGSTILGGASQAKRYAAQNG